MKSVKKIKSVASALSVIDFEYLWSSRSEEHVNSVCVGTVFQTAILVMFIVPRLRPGLLSRCSVLASSQILLAFYDKISIEKNNKKNREKYICLFLFIDILLLISNMLATC